MLFSQEKTIIPYDWSGHQGYVNINGRYMWNQDWISGPFFFDGTYASYPSLFGPEIESGFLSTKPDSLLLDTNTVTSYFDYVQGDYYLDNLAIAAEYTGNSRYCHLHGFKRTFAGAYNQYTPPNTTLRPIQQTYTAHYVSNKDHDEASVAIGHFNTNSGLPDTMGISLINSKITTTSIYWRHSKEPFYYKLEGNNFLQRFATDHSMALTSRTRYLTRSRYRASFQWKKDENKNLSFSITTNDRALRDTLFNVISWNELALMGTYSFLSLKTGIVKAGGDAQWIANGSANFQWRNFSITARLNRDVVPAHVSITDSLALETRDLIVISGKWSIQKLSISAWVYNNQFHYSHDLMLGNIDIPTNTWIAGELATKLKETWLLSVYYGHQKSDGIISDGIGDRINIRLLGQNKLFKGNLDIATSLSLHGWLNRKYQSVIHPVEFYPVNWISENNLMDKWFVNFSIIGQVRSFTVKYELHNVAQIMASIIDLGDSDFTLDVNPFFPPNRRLASLSLEWHFIE
jgi:hypothetical protein